MKVILQFDSDDPNNRRREYELLDDEAEALCRGEWANVVFSHPDHGEVFITSTARHENIWD